MSISAYVPVTVNNHSGVVISCKLTYSVNGVEETLDTGNYPAKETKTKELLGIATEITARVDYEAFIDDWKNAANLSYPDTSPFGDAGLVIDVTGTDGDVHVQSTPAPTAS